MSTAIDGLPDAENHWCLHSVLADDEVEDLELSIRGFGSERQGVFLM